MIVNVEVSYFVLNLGSYKPVIKITINTEKKKITTDLIGNKGLGKRMLSLIKKDYGREIEVISGGNDKEHYYTTILKLNDSFKKEYINGYFNDKITLIDPNLRAIVRGGNET